MRIFINFILKIVLIIIVLAYSLDAIFTYVFQNSEPYTKAQYIHKLKNRKFDYIFIGSSRVENSIIPQIIEQKTDKKVLNLGISALKLKDINYVIQLLYDYNISCHTFFIQVDYSYNDQEAYSKFFSSELLPYLSNNNLVIDNYLNATNSNYYFLKNLPFLKYSRSEQLIGFRKIFLSSLKTTNTYDLNKGYKPLLGTSLKKVGEMPSFIIKQNKYIKKIDEFAKKNRINICYFSAPVTTNTGNLEYFEKLKLKIPQLINLHDVVKDNNLFNDSSHLNHQGAVFFTNIIIERLKL